MPTVIAGRQSAPHPFRIVDHVRDVPAGKTRDRLKQEGCVVEWLKQGDQNWECHRHPDGRLFTLLVDWRSKRSADLVFTLCEIEVTP